MSIKRSLSAQRGAAALEYTMVLAVLITFAPVYLSNIKISKVYSAASYALTDGGTEGRDEPVIGRQGEKSKSSYARSRAPK